MMSRALNHIEEWLVTWLMATATIVIFLAVLHRYALGISWLWPYLKGISFNWAQELCIYLFIWMAKFGAAYGVRTGIHIGVDVLVRKLAPGKQRFFVMMGLSLGAFFTLVVTALGLRFVLFVKAAGAVSPDLGMPMWLVYLAVPLGSSLMCYRFLQVLTQFRRSGKLPSQHYQDEAAAS